LLEQAQRAERNLARLYDELAAEAPSPRAKQTALIGKSDSLDHRRRNTEMQERYCLLRN
jgi:hypothetical protein